MVRTLWLLTGMLFLPAVVCAQVQLPYILNGGATQRTCNCYVLTQDVTYTGGTVWNKNKISLLNSFDYYFDVNLGCKDDNGADGIGFILQTQGTNLGADGQGIGFAGISPSLGIIIDTWQNDDENDPPYDHLSIQMDGISNHSSPNNLAGPVTVLPDQDNIEDCNWHIFRIKWDATARQLEVSVDGQLRLSLQKDLAKDIFNGDPMVYWGFAGATGGFSNLQQFCAALRPQMAFNNDQLFCEGTPVTFGDSSKSFGVITRWQWDFGDGSTATVAQPPPHRYASAGNYTVKLVIEDNSGCVSDTLQQPVTIGTYPVADFTPQQLCLGSNMQLKNASTVKVGTLGHWQWNLGNGQTDTLQNPEAGYTTAGAYDVQLTVTTKEGCSDMVEKAVRVSPTPAVAATGQDVCIGSEVAFKGNNLTPDIPLQQWHWNFGNGDTATEQNINYLYPQGGSYQAGLYVTSADGCTSAVAYVPVEIIDLQLHAGRDTTIAAGQPLQLNAIVSGNDLQYTWAPSTGLNNPMIPDPVAVLQLDQTYYLTVTSPVGCVDKDTLSVKVYKGPEFYVPTAFSPNHDGRNDIFRAIAPGVPALDFFCVWDRWGQEVFHTQSLQTGWDGTFKGNDMPAGTYVWMIQGTDYLGRKFSRKGTVTIVR